MPLGDDVDGAVDHPDGGLVVDRVRRTRDAGCPLSLPRPWSCPACPRQSRCGQIEKSTIPSVLSSPLGGFHPTKSSPIRGVITMLPALSPTQTVSLSDGRRSASPDSRIQWHRYRASPPDTSRTSVSRTRGTQRSSSMLGSAVSSSTPKDFQPSSHMGLVGLSADEPPDTLSRTDVGVPVHRGGDAEGAGVGDRLAQQVDQRVVDARVLDARGSEKKPHACLLYVAVMTLSSRVGRASAVEVRLATAAKLIRVGMGAEEKVSRGLGTVLCQSGRGVLRPDLAARGPPRRHTSCTPPRRDRDCCTCSRPPGHHRGGVARAGRQSRSAQTAQPAGVSSMSIRCDPRNPRSFSDSAYTAVGHNKAWLPSRLGKRSARCSASC